MPAQLFWLYSLLGFLVFPFTFINFILTYTPFFSGIQPFVITTGSMEPAIPQGSIIYTIKESAYKKGDMITFISGNQAIAHRIVHSIKLSGQTYFSTKGDANTFQDYDLVTPTQINGKIATVVPIAGNIILFYRTPIGLFLGTLIPLLLLYPLLKIYYPRVLNLYRTS